MSEPPIALVIGYGNTLRGDDGVGPLAAETIQGWGLPGVSALAVPQLTPELAEPLASARLAVFVDARVSDEGDTLDVDVHALEPAERGSPARGHSGDPRQILALARDVYGNCPEAWLVTVASAEFGLGERLSLRATRGLAQALKRIASLLSLEPEPVQSVDSHASVDPRPRTDLFRFHA